MKSQKKYTKKRTKIRERPVKRTEKTKNIPLMNPYANLQASAVAYTPEDKVLKTSSEEPSVKKPGVPIDFNLPSINRTVVPSITSNQSAPSNDETRVGQMNQKGKDLIKKYYQMAAKYGAEAACAYLAKNPIAGLSIAPICGTVGSAVASVTADPFIKAVDYGLGFEKKMNERIQTGLSDAWGVFKKIF